MQSLLNPISTDDKAAQGLGARAHAQMVRMLSGLPADPGLPVNPVDAIDRTLLCQRNSEWLRALDKRSDGRTHFLAVGMRHLFKVDHDDAHCGGLLEDLRSQGWKIDLIK